MDKEQYTRIPNRIYDSLFRGDMTLSELKVYLLIIRRTYGFNRSTTRLSNGFIASKIGTTVRTANRIVKSLEKKGLIKIHSRGGGSHNAREVSVRCKQCPTGHPCSDTQVTINSDTQVTINSDTQVTQENKYSKINIVKETKKKEIAFLNSLPERIRVLDPSDLSDDDFVEWSDRRDAWEAEHGEIYAEDDV